MPCTDGGVPYPDYTLQNMQKRLDSMAQFLCGILRVLEFNYPELYSALMTTDPKLRVWWEEHKEHDRRQGRG